MPYVHLIKNEIDSQENSESVKELTRVSSFVVLAEEMTTVNISPSFRLTKGPFVMAGLDSDLWGLSSSSKRFPMNGKGFGLRESFLGIDFLLLAMVQRARIKVQLRQRYSIQLKTYFHLSVCSRERENQKKKRKRTLPMAMAIRYLFFKESFNL